MKKAFFLVLVSVLLVSCAEQKILNLSAAKHDVKVWYEKGEYEKELKVVVDETLAKLKEMKLDNTKAAVFDVDETSLSNYKHIKEIGFGYYPPLWEEWVSKAEATAINEVKRLYDYLVEKDVNIIFLTGRNYKGYKATYVNLMNVGYSRFDTLIVRMEDELKTKATVYKPAKRKEIVESKGYDIILCVGDQKSDLYGENTGLKVKLPNLLYQVD